MIGITIEELKILITAETAQLKTELKKTKQQLEGLNSKTTKVCSQMNASFKNVFKGVSFVAILAALTKIISKAVELSSNLEEVQNVVDTAFGSMSQEVNNFAKNALESFGMSELSAKKMASTFMAMSNGMGIAKKQGKDMALVLTQLAGDMSSFYNVSQDVAETALKSIYTGETEALKKFGIVLTETNLEAFAASLGKSYKNMSQMEKATLRYQYVLKATNQAQGDFAKTSNSWANQTRILKEQFNQLLSIIGKGLQNVLLPVVKGLNKILNYGIQVANVFAEVFGWSKTEMSKELEDIVEQLEDATDQAKELKRETAAFDELNIIGKEATEKEDPSGKQDTDLDETTEQVKQPNVAWIEKLKAVLLEIKSIIESIGRIFKDEDLTFAEKLKQAWQVVKEEIQLSDLTKPFVDLKTTVETTNQSISGLNNLLAAIPNNLLKIGLAAGAILGVKSALDFLSSAYTSNMELFGQLGGNLFTSFDAVKISLAQLGNTISSNFGTALSSIKSGLLALMSPMGLVIAAVALLAAGFIYAYSTSEEFRDKVNGCVNTVIATVKSFYDNVLVPMGNKIGEVFGVIADSFKENVMPSINKLLSVIGELWNQILIPLWQFLQPILIYIAGEFVALFSSGFNIIMNLLQSFGELAMEIFGGLIDIAAELIDFIVNVFTGQWDEAWVNVANIFGDCFNGLLDVMKGIVNSILGVINGLISGIETGVNFIVDALNSIKVDLPEWLQKLTGYTSFGFNLQKVELGEIPYLANGGVIESPTIAMVGEYAGAAHNPEIVSPKSLLEETINNSNNNVINSVFAMGNMIVKAIEDKDMNTYLDGMELSQGLYNHTGLIQRQKGNNLIK